MSVGNLKLLVNQQLILLNNLKVVMGALDRRIHFYRKKRLQCLINILVARKKKKSIQKNILRKQPTRKVWVKVRSSTFWEEDVFKNDDEFFKENFRMYRHNFEELCSHLQHLRKQDTNYRKSIPLEKRVGIALYALGSSAEYRSVGHLFGVGKCTVGKILKEFCKAVWNVLSPIYLSAYPLTEEIIRENVNGFEKLGFPQCFGAIDGCHIEIHPPAEDAVDYYNYKGWYSTVLLAVVDFRYRFLYINVGSPGRCNDSQIFENSSVRTQHENPLLKNMSRNLCNVSVPVVLIGDSAFKFSDILMKPYPFSIALTPVEKNFNYYLSKSRRVVENAFGHLKARFRRIGKGLDNQIENTNLIIKSCCVLHNFLNVNNDEINNHWIQHSKETIVREQPEFTIHINDTNPTAETIRNAISAYLAVEFDGASGLDNAAGAVDAAADEEAEGTTAVEEGDNVSDNGS